MLPSFKRLIRIIPIIASSEVNIAKNILNIIKFLINELEIRSCIIKKSGGDKITVKRDNTKAMIKINLFLI